MNKEDIKPLEELLDEVRDIDGFPIADDEDILKLSDPPYYTACPNPYINDFIEEHGTPYDPETDDYERKPFVGDISEGKNNSVYLAHTYHTKVPHKAIMKFINHYTEKGDIVIDGFCGSGMTGVAAQLSERNTIISDLSPVATFISKNYNNPVDPDEFEKAANSIIKEIQEDYKWMYETDHHNKTDESNQNSLFDEKNKKGEIKYTVWSDIYICPYCKHEHSYWEVGVDKETYNNFNEYKCPNCNASINKKDCERSTINKYDSAVGKEVEIANQKPVLINYSYEGKRYEKPLDKNDLEIIEEVKKGEIPYWFPTDKLPEGYNTKQPKNSHGIYYVHQFYTKRNLWIVSAIWNKIKNSQIDALKLLFTSFVDRHAVKRNRWYKGGPTRPLSNTLYMPYLNCEVNIFDIFKRKISDIKSALIELSDIGEKTSIISTQSLTDLKQINSNSADYCFTDPPFGGNIMYSEMNFVWESWLDVLTNNKDEAIVNGSQNKDDDKYQNLMEKSFKEVYRVLKPNRWITIEFHNSKASIWNSIQEALTRSGFIIAQVSILDKKQGTIHQGSNVGSVKNDLVINAYKPEKKFEDKFLKNAGEGLEADFVKEQLKHLPVGANIERTEQMLYSKMLAHYVENGFKIKYDANNFYKLLHDNFVELDGYWFLEDQAEEYSEWKSSLKLDEIEDIKKGNQVLFVVDEKSALTWINNFLDEPKEYGEIYTSYEQIATQTDDKIPELRELLDQNFILEDGKYRRPKTRKERESIEKSRTKNLERAWKKLLDRAKNGSRKIKNIRKEALIHGFTKCYQQENYEDIVTVADRLYKSTLESSGDILDFVDIARMKTE